jgi:V/A-type H+-transporting ATPase subunit I
MAVIPMQKVAVIAHKDQQEDLVQFLHKEGVMEISDAREAVPVDHSEVKFRTAELEFAIATLKDFASKKALAAMRKAEARGTEEQVQHAATHTDVLGIVEELHKLDKDDQHMSAIVRGVDPDKAMNVGEAASEQAAYFASNVKEDMSRIRGGAGTTEAEPGEQHKLNVGKAQVQIEKNKARRAQLAEELPNLVLLRRYIHWLNEKQTAREAMQKTKMTVMLLGWIPRDTFQLFEQRLHQAIPSSAVLKVKADEGENPPVFLRNSKMLTPFESVTKLYGLPQHNEIDPTPFLSIFFILFFGLCLTDAGYGLVLAFIMGGYLLKTRKSVSEAPLFWLLMLSGVVTFLVSIPFGGWFGLSPDKVPEYLTKPDPDGTGRLFIGQIWNLSDQTGITFLQNLSLALGIIHLSFGIFLGAYSKMRGGQLAAGFWVDGTALIFIGTVLLYFFGPAEYQQYFLYAIGAALVLMIWGKGHGNPLVKRPMFGFLQTLNFFLGMMGNVLSYLRILALGLVTGALAFTVNLVAEQIGALLPFVVAVPVVIVIYIVGHMANIVLNVLGAFIHSGRLQFVEFFSQFFEGGGRPYRPFIRS